MEGVTRPQQVFLFLENVWLQRNKVGLLAVCGRSLSESGVCHRNPGVTFREKLAAMDIREVLTAPQSPWQNAFAERLIGTIRRECLNHVIVLGERHLRWTLRNYFGYYHRFRTHLALEKDAPETRPVENAAAGPIVEVPEVGGLHHHYERRAS
jgi:putative transposase